MNTKNVSVAQISASDRKTALWLFFVPLTGLIITNLSYPLIRIFEMLHYKKTPFLFHNLAVIFLGLLAAIFLLATLVCISIALSLLNKKVPSDTFEFDQRSGKGKYSIIPEELKKWSWGAFGLNVVWGVYFRVWISLFAFVPLIGLIVMILLGIKGNEWAWKKNAWTSIEEFKKTQENWKFWGVLFFIINCIGALVMFFLELAFLT